MVCVSASTFWPVRVCVHDGEQPEPVQRRKYHVYHQLPDPWMREPVATTVPPTVTESGALMAIVSVSPWSNRAPAGPSRPPLPSQAAAASTTAAAARMPRRVRMRGAPPTGGGGCAARSVARHAHRRATFRPEMVGRGSSRGGSRATTGGARSHAETRSTGPGDPRPGRKTLRRENRVFPPREAGAPSASGNGAPAGLRPPPTASRRSRPTPSREWENSPCWRRRAGPGSCTPSSVPRRS